MIFNRTDFRMKLLPLVIGASTLSLPIYAQSSDSEAKERVLEEVMVTAQRRSERLEDVPLSLTVATGEQLENAGVNNLEDISKISAGVQVNRGGAFSQPAIRGISTLTLGAGLENNVAVYIDGVYQPDAVAMNADLANIGSVQVLKGPQGTLYGRNATGGAFVIETLAPSEDLEGALKVSYGRFDDKRFRGYVSAPISDRLGYSLAANWRESDGYIEDIDTGDDAAPIKSESLRAKLRWDATDSLGLTFGYNYTEHLDARGLTYRIPTNGVLGAPVPPRDKVSQNVKGDNTMALNELSMRVSWDTEVGTLTSVTAYSERESNSIFDFDGTASADVVRGVATDIQQETVQQSLDFNITSIERWNINIGGMYYDDRFRINDNESWSNFTLRNVQDVRLDAEALSAYVDATWEATESLFLTVGARYSSEDRSGGYNVNDPNTGDDLVPRTDKDESYSATTPRLVARYQIDDQSNVYASYTEGFRSGAFFSGSQADPDLYNPVDQEKIKAYEIGFKTAQSYFRFSTAAFYYDYQDLQVGLTVPNPIGNGVIQQIFNAPEAEVYGAEIQVDVAATESLNVRAGLAFTHGEYTDFDNVQGGTGFDPSGPNNVSAQTQNWTGHEMARAPEWTANIGADYTIDTKVGTVVLVVNANYSDSYVVQNLSLYGPLVQGRENDQRYRQGSFALVNAKADWTDTSERYTVGLYADNISNERYFLTTSGTGLGDYNQYASPATYGVSFGYRF